MWTVVITVALTVYCKSVSSQRKEAGDIAASDGHFDLALKEYSVAISYVNSIYPQVSNVLSVEMRSARFIDLVHSFAAL